MALSRIMQEEAHAVHWASCRLGHPWAYVRQHPHTGSWQEKRWQASSFLFLIMCDSTLLLPGSTTTQEHPHAVGWSGGRMDVRGCKQLIP